jgi:hypothetical protein
MSTAGTYGFHPKIMNQKSILQQMTSNSLQPPFYFGGSQVPINLGFSHGEGLRSIYKPSLHSMKSLGTQGRGLENTYSRHNRIALPKHMSTIKRVI